MGFKIIGNVFRKLVLCKFFIVGLQDIFYYNLGFWRNMEIYNLEGGEEVFGI